MNVYLLTLGIVAKTGSNSSRRMYVVLSAWHVPSYRILEHGGMERSFLWVLRRHGTGSQCEVPIAAPSMPLEVNSIPRVVARTKVLTYFKGAVETLDLEVKSFGIRTLLVEPGFFRTELLNADNTKYVQTTIKDYEPLTGELYGEFQGAHHQQPGSPEQGVRRIIELMNGEGQAAGKYLLEFLALGGDAVEQLRSKCQKVLKLLDEWQPVSSNTNFSLR